MRTKYEDGYGLDCSDAIVRPEKEMAFFRNHVKTCPEMWREFIEYCRDADDSFDEESLLTNGKDKDSIDPELVIGFIDGYENDSTGTSGFGALMVDTINACLYAHEKVFVLCDMCIYVTAYIPEDGNESRRLPTRKEIRDILARYVTPYLEETGEAKWLSICLYGIRHI